MMLSIILTILLVNLLRFLVSEESFNPKIPAKQIRIFVYSEIETPLPIGNGNFGMTAYPVLQQQETPNVLAEVAIIPDRTKKPGRHVPGLRQLAGSIGGLPDAMPSDKYSDERQSMRDYSVANIPDDRHDLQAAADILMIRNGRVAFLWQENRENRQADLIVRASEAHRVRQLAECR